MENNEKKNKALSALKTITRSLWKVLATPLKALIQPMITIVIIVVFAVYIGAHYLVNFLKESHLFTNKEKILLKRIM